MDSSLRNTMLTVRSTDGRRRKDLPGVVVGTKFQVEGIKRTEIYDSVVMIESQVINCIMRATLPKLIELLLSSSAFNRVYSFYMENTYSTKEFTQNIGSTKSERLNFKYKVLM